MALTTGEEIAVYTHDADDRRVTRLFKNAAQTVLRYIESYYDVKGRVLDQVLSPAWRAVLKRCLRVLPERTT